MAAPILLASVIPKSVTRPPQTAAMRTPLPPMPTTEAPDAVAVHWDVGGRWPPYSSGKRNCRSAEQKWEEVTAQQMSAAPLSTKMADMPSVCAMVEQAPNWPNRGTLYSRRPKVEATF